MLYTAYIICIYLYRYTYLIYVIYKYWFQTISEACYHASKQIVYQISNVFI